MSQSNTQIEVSELDFGKIKTSLKNYLRGQSAFADFDFEGSNINILLDLLAYNTHYNAFYLNMVANERYIDTAQLRNNIVSRAKELGYTPTSARGARAGIRMTVTPTSGAISGVTIPKNLEFTTTINDNTYTFVTPSSISVNQRNNNNQFIADFEIVEGTPLTHKFPVTDANSRIYTLPNKNIDTTSIGVKVWVSNTNSTNTTFTQATDLKSIGANTNVFFVQEGDDEQYQIEFGDGVLGNKLLLGNLIEVEYRVTNAEVGNGANTFIMTSGSVDGHSNVSFTVTSAATGGVSQENEESIRFNAPKHYERQDRLVTSDDYRSFIVANFPEFESVNVWSGDVNDPPIYGKVFISVKPFDAEIISTSKKNAVNSKIKDENVLTMSLEFVDADFIYLEFDTTVKYDEKETSLTSGELSSKIQSAIIAYGATTLSKFGRKFRYSKLIRAIDDIDPSVRGNLTSIRMQKRFTPQIGKVEKHIIDFKNPIHGGGDKHGLHQGHEINVYSNNTFTYKGIAGAKLEDNAQGNMEVYHVVNNLKVNIDNNVGSVDYENGIVTLNSFILEAIENSGSDIELVAKPNINDIVSERNNILVFDPTRINVTMVEDSD